MLSRHCRLTAVCGVLLHCRGAGRWPLDSVDNYLTGPTRWLQAHGPFLLITLVGVQPALQCRGIGSGLLRRVLRYADDHNLPSYLEVCLTWKAC